MSEIVDYSHIPGYYGSYTSESILILITTNGGKKIICQKWYNTIETIDKIWCGSCSGCYQSLVLPKDPNFIDSTDQPNDPIYAITRLKK
jgi:hypothetical protein